MKAYLICNTIEYEEWLEQQPWKSRVQIYERISRIQDEGHFGDYKNIDAFVYELRWKNGRRIYYAYIPTKKILLLLGGNKNGQNKDIQQAKKVFNKHISYEK